MRSLANHPCLTLWTDPTSGVTSYAVSVEAVPHTKGHYFQTPGMRGDGRWVWGTCFHPPAQCSFPFVLDLDGGADAFRWFPRFANASNTLVTPAGDAAWVPVDDGIWRQPADGSEPTLVGRLPKDVIAGRHLFRLVTDLSLSADGQWFLLDSQIGNRWVVGLLHHDTGEYRQLASFPVNHTHADFHPSDPELFLIMQGPGTDVVSGERYNMNVRMWLMDVHGERYEPVDGSMRFGHSAMNCHEWWTPSGKLQWCDYRDGITELDLATREKRVIWPRPLTHGQTDPSERLIVGDENPYHWNERKPCAIWALDRLTGRELPIVTRQPPMPFEWHVFRRLHLDPHPQVSGCGQWVISTSAVLGRMSCMLTPVPELLSAIAERGQPIEAPGATATA